MSMDRKLIATTQPYEVGYWRRYCKKLGLTKDEADGILKTYGRSRERCKEAALRHAQVMPV